MTEYRRRESEWWEELAAASVAATVGLAAFYLVRLWLGREPLGGTSPEAPAATGRAVERAPHAGPGEPRESGS